LSISKKLKDSLAYIYQMPFDDSL